MKSAVSSAANQPNHPKRVRGNRLLLGARGKATTVCDDCVLVLSCGYL